MNVRDRPHIGKVTIENVRAALTELEFELMSENPLDLDWLPNGYKITSLCQSIAGRICEIVTDMERQYGHACYRVAPSNQELPTSQPNTISIDVQRD